ncbi:MAG TPA: hypothetical protein V6D14_02565 [Coleofasciculaceae cyanobacterium]|jgi:hypothetical protein
MSNSSNSALKQYLVTNRLRAIALLKQFNSIQNSKGAQTSRAPKILFPEILLTAFKR